MTPKAKKGLIIGGSVLGVVAVAVGAFLLLGNRSDIPVLGEVLEPAKCPLSGLEPKNEKLIDRPAVAVKIENSPAAYPLSGLEDAEVVYEEPVEGGLTRFMAIYHCTDALQAGPVRSARAVDPAIMTPITRILAFSGANGQVLNALDEAEVVQIDENNADGALERIPRAGVSLEHTLYAHTKELRRLGRKGYDDAPEDVFEFGDLEGRAKRARTVNINFNASNTISYEWSGGRYKRFEGGAPFMSDTDEQLAADNILIEEHTVDFSEIRDVVGNPSTEIADVTGSGRAVLFRDGRAIVGRWRRESIEGAAVFETKAGDTMVFSPGTIWVELVPDQKGDVKGSFDY